MQRKEEINELYQEYKSEYEKIYKPAFTRLTKLQKDLQLIIDLDLKEKKETLYSEVNQHNKNYNVIWNKAKSKEDSQELKRLEGEMKASAGQLFIKYQQEFKELEEKINVKLKEVEPELNELKKKAKEAGEKIDKTEAEKIQSDIEKIENTIKELKSFENVGGGLEEKHKLIEGGYDSYELAKRTVDQISSAINEASQLKVDQVSSDVNEEKMNKIYADDEKGDVYNNKDLYGMLYFSKKDMNEAKRMLDNELPAAIKKLQASDVPNIINNECEKVEKEYGKTIQELKEVQAQKKAMKEQATVISKPTQKIDFSSLGPEKKQSIEPENTSIKSTSTKQDVPLVRKKSRVSLAGLRTKSSPNMGKHIEKPITNTNNTTSKVTFESPKETGKSQMMEGDKIDKKSKKPDKESKEVVEKQSREKQYAMHKKLDVNNKQGEQQPTKKKSILPPLPSFGFGKKGGGPG